MGFEANQKGRHCSRHNVNLRAGEEGTVMKKREEVPTIEYLNKTKQDTMKMLTAATTDRDDAQLQMGVYEMVVEECDKEIARQQQVKRDIKAAVGSAQTRVMSALVVIVILVLASIVLTSCQTVKGLTGDAGWILTKTSNNIQIEQEKK